LKIMGDTNPNNDKERHYKRSPDVSGQSHEEETPKEVNTGIQSQEDSQGEIVLVLDPMIGQVPEEYA
jgi:hypothetical protein